MVAVILLVAITVVLTAVLYYIVTDISQSSQQPPPHVALTNTDTTPPYWTFVVSAAEVRPLIDYEIRLWVNGSNDPASVMKPVAPETRGNVTYSSLGGPRTS